MASPKSASAGPSIMAAAGVAPGPRNEKRFRQWLARLLAQHLSGA
jgi:hypothetical protein